MEALFAPYGTISELDFPVFEDSGRSRGFARVTFSTKAAAAAALAGTNGTVLNNRAIIVEKAVPRAFVPPPSSVRPKAIPPLETKQRSADGPVCFVCKSKDHLASICPQARCFYPACLAVGHMESVCPVRLEMEGVPAGVPSRKYRKEKAGAGAPPPAPEDDDEEAALLAAIQASTGGLRAPPKVTPAPTAGMCYECGVQDHRIPGPPCSRRGRK